MEMSDASIGVVSASQTHASYAWFFDSDSSGSYIKDLSATTAISLWEASTAVTSGELRTTDATAVDSANRWKLWQSNSARTTGGSFDSTEQANWTEVGNGTGQVTRLVYLDDSAASEYLIEFGKITGDGYKPDPYGYAVHQASSATTTKSSVKVEHTDADIALGIGACALRNPVITVENVTQLQSLRNVTNGTVARTLGYTTIGDGLGRTYVYQSLSRPGSESVFQLNGTGSTDWWKAVDPWLHLNAGTTTQAPLKLTTGSLLTTPETGTLEFANDRLYYTSKTDRHVVTLADGIIINDASVSSSITETVIYEEEISANELHLTQLVKARFLGIYSTANASDTFTARLVIGGTTVASLVSAAKNVTNGGFDIEFTFTVRSLGATGTIQGHATAKFDNDSVTAANTTTTTINTTAADNITLTIQWSAADASNIVTLKQAYTEFIN